MGMTLGAGIADFLKEGQREDFADKRILMLGKQSLQLRLDELCWLADRLHYPLTKTEIAFDGEGNLDSSCFFRMLGFAEVYALDYSDYEDADFIFDLNSANLPEELKRRFDYILDGGTLEHVYHVPNALSNIVGMLRVGGKVFHYIPAERYVDHGFYSFSPCLLHDFYEANRFFIEDISILFHDQNSVGVELQYEANLRTKVDCRLVKNVPGEIKISSEYRALLCCIAVKKEDADGLNTPLQSVWKEQYLYRNPAPIFQRIGLAEYPDRSVAIWGAGETARSLVRWIEANNLEQKICGICDRMDVNEFPKNWMGGGYRFLDYRKTDVLRRIKAIVIAAIDYEEEIYARIRHLESDHLRVIKLFNRYERVFDSSPKEK